jgi:hypothetical protein
MVAARAGVAAQLWDVWYAMGGWDAAAEEVVAGGVKLTSRPLLKEHAEHFAVDHEMWAEADYGPGQCVLLDPATGARCTDSIIPLDGDTQAWMRREALSA